MNDDRFTPAALAVCVVFFSFQPLMAQTATVSLEVGGSNSVDYIAIAGGFTLDIVLSTQDSFGMTAFGLSLEGAPGFAYAENAHIPVGGTAPELNYAVELGWDAVNGRHVSAGVLPMSGLAGELIGTSSGAVPASDGRAAWIEFVAVPQAGIHVIDATDVFVGNADFGRYDVAVIPLTITPEPASLVLGVFGFFLPFGGRRGVILSGG